MQQELPVVSIVTPSYNKGRFIEETILSIKNQTYPRIEHIVIDGGSTDNTLDIIKKYEGTYNMQWISEPDRGQSDAINKGWSRAKGEILAYLNADDTYMPWAVETAVKFLTEQPDVSMVYGDCVSINEHSEVIHRHRPGEFDLKKMLCYEINVPQPTVFFKRNVLDKVGYLDTNLNLAMDLDFWIRVGLRFKIEYIPQTLATWRFSPEAKSVSQSHKVVYDLLYIHKKTFSNAELAKEMRALERRAYSVVHLRGGIGYHSQGQMGKARKHLMKAVILHPQHFKDAWLLGYLITSLLGGKATKAIIKWKRKLIDKVSF